MNIINIIFMIFLITLIIYKKYDETWIILLIFLYYLFKSNNSIETFNNESIQNAYSMLNDKKLIVGSLKVNNGATIGGVQFNCESLNFGNFAQNISNSEESINMLKNLSMTEENIKSEEYSNLMNNMIHMRNGNNQLFQLIAPNKSVLSGVTVGDDNAISIIAPNPSNILQFNAQVEETIVINGTNVPQFIPIHGVISEEIFNYPTSETSKNLMNQIITYRPPMPEFVNSNQETTICTLPYVKVS